MDEPDVTKRLEKLQLVLDSLPASSKTEPVVDDDHKGLMPPDAAKTDLVDKSAILRGSNKLSSNPLSDPNDFRGLEILGELPTSACDTYSYPNKADLFDDLQLHTVPGDLAWLRAPNSFHHDHLSGRYSNPEDKDEPIVLLRSLNSDCSSASYKLTESECSGGLDVLSDTSCNDDAHCAGMLLGKCYPCKTQDDGTSSLAFEMERQGSIAEVHRFRPGSMLKYYIDKSGLSDMDFGWLQSGVSMAADSWTQRSIGITFEPVENKRDATFLVVFDPDLKGAYAKAFFPGKKKKRTIRFSSLSFEPKNIAFIWNISCHELGHVIGLRHTGQKSLNERRPFYFPTTETDDASVMNTELVHDLSLFVISDRDAAEARQLYSLPSGFHRHSPTELQPFSQFRIIDV